jgi:tetratricopeptide (TPR) repeat protein
MGAVYEVLDRETQGRLALKTLLFSKADSLLAFKQEFREFQHISHPNLVTLGDLYEEEGLWFFTMDLVDGSDFLAHVRGAREPTRVSATAATVAIQSLSVHHSLAPPSVQTGFDEGLLRDGLIQVTRGLMALHDAGKVHRDIKPSNVLVGKDGRVVVLDFGIAADVSRADQLTQSRIVGTPHYMAPEQAAATPVGPPADWYSVGVMLYEALVGELPFDGPLLKVIEAKQWRTPPSPADVRPGLPSDLCALCMDMLSTQPESRPSGKQILGRLGTRESVSRIVARPSTGRSETFGSHFVGREAELHGLHHALEGVQRLREACAVYIFGESGVGKSALVTRFVETARTSDPDVVVLEGRCLEHEAVPYKAIDGVVDALSRFLARQSKDRVLAWLPRHAPLLAQAFPVLWRIEAIAEQPRPRREMDPLEQRSRVFDALRQLLARISDAHSLVVTIDDLQWADEDSFALLSELVRRPESPAFLLVATVRSEPTDEALRSRFEGRSIFELGQRMTLGRLDGAEAKELAGHLIRRAGIGMAVDAQELAREAAGHPLFIDELVRHRVVAGESASHLTLEEALWARIERLDPRSKELLHTVSVGPGALLQADACRAARLDLQEALRHIKRLKAAHLVRTTGGTRATDTIEPYHGRVRDVVLHRLPDDDRRAIQRRLAVVLESSGRPVAAELAILWSAVGDRDRAAAFASDAADAAERALAFERASQFLKLAIAVEPSGATDRIRRLRARLADALANAGRSEEAADAYLETAKSMPAIEALELRRRAVQQLLYGGHIDRGMMLLREVLREVDMPLPNSRAGAFLSLAWGRVRARSMVSSAKLRPSSAVAPRDIARVDICWSAAAGLSFVDTILGAEFQTKHLVLALEVGEPVRVARALATEAAFRATGGPTAARAVEPLLDRANALARDANDPHARAHAALGAAIVALQSSRWEVARARYEEAEQILREQCVGVAWELTLCQVGRLAALHFLGDLRELTAAVPRLIHEAERRGDLFASTRFRLGYFNLAWLTAGDVDSARRAIDTALRGWPRKGFTTMDFFAIIAKVQLALFDGSPHEAWQELEAPWSELAGSRLLGLELVRIQAHFLRARAALRALEAPKPPSGATDAARDAVRQLAREEAPWARSAADLCTGALQLLDKDLSGTARSLGRAAEDFSAAGMKLFAACTRMHLARLQDPSASERTRLQVVAYFDEQRVAFPERFASMVAPGFSRLYASEPDAARVPSTRRTGVAS